MKTKILNLAILAFLCFQLVQAGGSEKECEIKDNGATLAVTNIYGPCSPFKLSNTISWFDYQLKLLERDRNRLIFLDEKVVGKKSPVPIAWGRNLIQTPTFIVRVNIGTPAQTLLMALDTSNDAAWIPCFGCVGCSSTSFNPNKSSTFAPLGCLSPQCKQVPATTCTSGACTYNTTYGGSSISASLAKDNFTLATDTTPNYAFFCLQKVTGSSVPPQGLLGLGRGPSSLLSQTQNLYKSIFSYCLPSLKSLNFSGSLKLGPSNQPIKILYTPLLRNPRRSSLYYVNLVGIRVGSKVLAIPPSALAFNGTSGAGTIIDSGTVYTSLVQPAYIAVRDEFRRVIAKKVPKNTTVTALGGFDTCYSVPNLVAPTITFVFQGYNMSLPQDNILLRSSTGSLACLAMAGAPNNVNSVLNVIASMQQQNFRIVFDVANSRIGISRENCSK